MDLFPMSKPPAFLRQCEKVLAYVPDSAKHPPVLSRKWERRKRLGKIFWCHASLRGGLPNRLFQLRPRLPGTPTLLKLRLGLLQGRHPIRSGHRTIDRQRPEPAQMFGTAAGLVDAADVPAATVDGVIRPVLVDAGADTRSGAWSAASRVRRTGGAKNSTCNDHQRKAREFLCIGCLDRSASQSQNHG
jgi:hypothetical protein